MVYDLNMLKSFYASYKGKMEHVRAPYLCILLIAEGIYRKLDVSPRKQRGKLTGQHP